MKQAIRNQPVHKHVRTWIHLLAAAMLVVPLAGLLMLARSVPASAAATGPPAVAPRHPAATVPHAGTPARSGKVAAATALEEKWGIKVSSIGLANGDSAVEVRYTVFAPEKTSLLSAANAETYLIDQATGTKLPMITAPSSDGTGPATMPDRSVRNMMRLAGMFPPPPSRLLAGNVYSVKIPNWDNILTSGATVAFVVGSERVDNLVVK